MGRIDIENSHRRLLSKYEKFGKIVFEEIKDKFPDDELTDSKISICVADDIKKTFHDVEDEYNNYQEMLGEYYRCYSKIICPNCGKALSPESSFCINCGSKVELPIMRLKKDEKECINCRKIITVDSQFCKYCGTSQN